MLKQNIKVGDVSSLDFMDDAELGNVRKINGQQNGDSNGYSRSKSITYEDDQITFSWENLLVTTKETQGFLSKMVKGNKGKTQKTLVDNISGYMKPGELVAIMGASGAGKSTLLNALTFRYDELNVSGNRYVNGNLVGPDEVTALSAYIMQDDVFIGTLTPREHLEFMAKVRMDRSVPKKQRKERVDAVITELGLSKCQNTLIGKAGIVKGISGGESKRLAFATEILTNPPLLFCDEPTSGLDSYMAQNVVEALRELSGRGKGVICTIHQPSSQVFAMFDKVLLMAEGKMAYLGDLDLCFNFFADCGFPCPDKFNPADHYVNVMAIIPGDEEESIKRVEKIVEKFNDSQEGGEILEMVEYEKTHQKMNKSLISQELIKGSSKYKATWGEQFSALLIRAFSALLKEPQFTQVSLFQAVMSSLLIGAIFYGQEHTQNGVTSINGAIFIVLMFVTFTYQLSVINVFCLELPVFLREHYNGAYRVDTYYITKSLAEMPLFLVLPIISCAIIYWMVGMNSGAGQFVVFTLAIILLGQVSCSWGYLLSILAGDVQLALAVAPTLMIPLMLFGGFFLNSDNIPSWLRWLKYFSWIYFSNEFLAINQWDGVEDIECDQKTTKYDLPSGYSCTLDQNGTISTPTSLDVPVPCMFENGSDVIAFYSMDEDNYAVDIIALILFMVVLRVGGLLALHAKAYRRRG